MTLLCHLPAVLITAPMCAAHVIWLSRGRGRRRCRRVIGLAFATLLGVGLAAFYVMPALLELDLIQIRAMTEHAMDFHGNFVPPWLWIRFALGYAWSFGASVSDVTDLMPMHISAAHWMFIAAAMIVTVVQVRRHTIDWRVAGLIQWLGVTAFAMFMMTSSSTFVWDAIPALAYIQFPWRFFMLLSISGAALGALLMSFATSRRRAGGSADPDRWLAGAPVSPPPQARSVRADGGDEHRRSGLAPHARGEQRMDTTRAPTIRSA